MLRHRNSLVVIVEERNMIRIGNSIPVMINFQDLKVVEANLGSHSTRCSVHMFTDNVSVHPIPGPPEMCFLN